MDIETYQSLSLSTLALHEKALERFRRWLVAGGVSTSLAQLVAVPRLLDALLRHYGVACYRGGQPRYLFVVVVTAMQRFDASLNSRILPNCWALIGDWEEIEPHERRPPLPWAIFKALFAAAMGAGLHRWAGVLLISFLGIMRISEPLRALRRHLLLPPDAISDDWGRAFLLVEKPKSGRRGGARVQHGAIRSEAAVRFLWSVFGPLEPGDRLFPAGPGAYRLRWDRLMSVLGVPVSAKLTPGCCRGGGAVHAFLEGMGVSDLLWAMRLKQPITLSHYLQETVAISSLCDLSADAKSRIRLFASAYEPSLRARLAAAALPPGNVTLG